MNIFLPHSKTKGSTASYCEAAFRRKHHVEVFDTREMADWGVGLGRAFPKRFPTRISKVLKSYRRRPDLIVQIDDLGRRTFWGLRDCKISSVYWAIDSHRPKYKFQLAIARYFDLVFVAQKDYVEIFRRVNKSSFWLPLACEREIHKDLQMDRDYDIVFVGNLNPRWHLDRVRLLRRLSEKFNVKAFEGVYGEEMARVYSRAKIVFNKSVGNEVNMRVFEAMACGAMLLTDDIEDGMKDLFVDREHLVLYKEYNIEDLAAYYLEHDQEREEIAREGQREVLQKHTYDHRIDTMILSFADKFPKSSEAEYVNC